MRLTVTFSKNKIPNAFVETSFKKHTTEILNESSGESFSIFFIYVTSTRNRKEKINKHINNVSLNQTDCRYEEF